MAKVKVYRTVSGDTWDLIAFKVYGSEGYFHDLIRNNLRLIDIIMIKTTDWQDTSSKISQVLSLMIQEEKKLHTWLRYATIKMLRTTI